MISEIAWSTIKDTNSTDINNSPIWKDCYKDEEMTEELKQSSFVWYKYTIKFDGTKPVQLTKMETIKGVYDGVKNKKSNNKRDHRR